MFCVWTAANVAENAGKTHHRMGVRLYGDVLPEKNLNPSGEELKFWRREGFALVCGLGQGRL